MTDQITSQTTSRSQQPVGGFPLGAWVRANAVGLGIAYALFALFGGVAEELGADHDSVTRNLAIIAGLFIGAAVFALMRRKVLAPHLGGSLWTAMAAGVSLAAGFVLGFIMAGPPFDFVLGVIALGTIGGALQWRRLRCQLARPGRLFLIGIGAWVTAAVTAVAVVIPTGDAIDAAFGSGVTGFVAVTLVIGLVAGAVGGAIEGAALRRRIGLPT